MLSVIIPVLNEAEEIETRLKSLQFIRENGHEIILIDGGSEDDTISLAKPYVDIVLSSKSSRSLQMNTGALHAKGNVLFFLHLDSQLSENIFFGLKVESWGFCKIKLSGKHFLFRIIETMMNLRSRITHIATGDQGLIISKNLFEQIGGYPDIALMEDVQICKKLKQFSKPTITPDKIVTSSRRWEEHGIIKTTLLMWYLRLLYFVGVEPEKLAARYYPRA